jgi:sulfatase modifying factor 1
MRVELGGPLLALGIAAIVIACNGLNGAADLSFCEGAACTAATAADPREGGPGGAEGGLMPGLADDAGGGLPPKCTAGETQCVGRFVATCIGDAWKNAASPCISTCAAGKCVVWPSCTPGASTACAAGADCCASSEVEGGTFNRLNTQSLPATVSTFDLDRYEVTVSRFRAFVAAGAATSASPPAAGAGAHPKIAGSGWQSSWNNRLPSSVGTVVNTLKGTNATWTDQPGANEALPINYVSWLEAFAFCAWDGGRLPTLAEWSYAASGGAEQRYYAWSVPASSTTIAQSNAAFDCLHAAPGRVCPAPYCDTGGGPCDVTCVAPAACVYPSCTGCDLVDLARVGSLSGSAGRFGQFDLGGNVAEHVLDPRVAGGNRPVPCVDCATLTGSDPMSFGGNDRLLTVMGGGFTSASTSVRASSSSTADWNERADNIGFRCAR